MVSAWYWVLIGLVGIERLAELWVSKRNAAWSLERGGVEHCGGHYPVMVVLHAALLVGCCVEPVVASRPFVGALGGSMIILVVLAQGVRWWCIRTLGMRWNTRVIVVPGGERVRYGPYRWVSHPNYVAVMVEGLALPLVHSAWVTASLFTVLNAALLRVRIRCEDQALSALEAS